MNKMESVEVGASSSQGSSFSRECERMNETALVT